MLNYINIKLGLKNKSVIRIILQELTSFTNNKFLNVFASNENRKLGHIPLEHNCKCLRT